MTLLTAAIPMDNPYCSCKLNNFSHCEDGARGESGDERVERRQSGEESEERREEWREESGAEREWRVAALDPDQVVMAYSGSPGRKGGLIRAIVLADSLYTCRTAAIPMENPYCSCRPRIISLGADR